MKRTKRSLDLVSIPSFKHYLHTSQVIHLYRSFLRLIQCMPPNQHTRDIKQQITNEFHSNKNISVENSKVYLNFGKKQYQFLQEMVEVQAKTGQGHEQGHDRVERKREEVGEVEMEVDADEMIVGKIRKKDNSNEGYVVGVGWPWEKKK